MSIEGILNRNDVVISSRIRLARNIADFPFVNICSEDQRSQIESTVRDGLIDDQLLSQLSYVDSIELEALERQFLLDLQLIRHRDVDSELSVSSQSPTGLASGAAIKVGQAQANPFDDLCLTINEEDHLRLTVTRSDFDLMTAWEQISRLDDQIEQYINYAYSPRWGYLTACPANVGTGMRISVLVHLPALVIAGQTEKVFRSVQRVNVVARGMLGDRAVGDFFRISNQSTLGCTETQLIEHVAGVIPALVKYETEAREFLLDQNREGIRRRVMEALKKLCLCDLDDTSSQNNEEIMSFLSLVRMGLSMGLLGQEEASKVKRLFSLVQLRHRLFAAITREDYSEASLLRDQIKMLENGAGGQSDLSSDANDGGIA